MRTEKGRGSVRGCGVLALVLLACAVALPGCTYTKVIRDDSVDAKVNRSLGGTGAFNKVSDTASPNQPNMSWR